jgi:predicted N-acetyltransferase YhbS
LTRLNIRPLGESDLATVHSLSQSAGWPHRLEDLRLFLAFGEGIAACDAEGKIAGIAMWWRYGDDAATIGVVVVESARQGQGIGRRLMQDVLDRLGARRLMLNATAAGLKLYEALGFRAIGMVHQHQAEIRTSRGDPRVRPLQPAEHADAVALDTTAFGAPRTALVTRLLAISQGAAIGSLDGFALRRQFGRGQMIGPMVAPDEDAAIALVSALLEPGFVRIDIPGNATRLGAWLTEAGLPKTSDATVMIRGDWRLPATPRRYALVSQALG